MKRAFCFLALPVFLLALAALPSHADDDQALARELSRSGRILSLEQITQRALTVRAGRLLDIDLEEKRGRYIYEVEILDRQGKTWEIKLDARTGEVLHVEEDD